MIEFSKAVLGIVMIAAFCAVVYLGLSGACFGLHHDGCTMEASDQ